MSEKHIIKEGSRKHVISYHLQDGKAIDRCSEPNCEINVNGISELETILGNNTKGSSLKHHRNTEGLSDLGKQIINSCPKAYINEHGQVIDPCHVWFSNPMDETKW